MDENKLKSVMWNIFISTMIAMILLVLMLSVELTKLNEKVNYCEQGTFTRMNYTGIHNFYINCDWVATNNIILGNDEDVNYWARSMCSSTFGLAYGE